MWQELWWSMAKGIKSEYDQIKATEIIEFYKLLDLWNAKIKAENEALKNKKQQ